MSRELRMTQNPCRPMKRAKRLIDKEAATRRYGVLP